MRHILDLPCMEERHKIADEGATNNAIESFIEECRKPGDVVVFTDGSMV